MAVPPKKITPTRLAEARDEEEYWRRKSVAAGLRQEAVSLDPSLGEGSAVSRHSTRTSISEEYADHYREGVKIRGFREGLGESVETKTRPQAPTHDVAGTRARIIEALVKLGKSADEISVYLEKVSPYLDLAALAGTDPVANSILYTKVMSSNSQPALRDLVEVLKLSHELRPQTAQSNSDPASMVAAVAKVFEAAQQRNTDPVKTFNDGMSTVMPLFQAMNENQKLAFTTQIESLKSELKNADPGEFFSRMRELAESLGWHPGGSEDPEVLKHRLNLADAQSQRAFELERERWRHEIETKQEAAKDRRQADLVKGVTSGISKIFESPVVKELGRGVGQKIGVSNPVARAGTVAAKEALENPLEAAYDFQCQKCHKSRKFSAKELLSIAEKQQGRWVCDCGEAYKLRDNKSPGKDGGAPTF